MPHHDYLLENPTNEQWQHLLHWAFKQARMAEFMTFDVRAPLPKNLRPYEDHLIDSFITCHYRGARQLRAVRVMRFELVPPLRAFLASRPALADWDAPPPAIMDPALYQAEERPLLWTMVHKDLAFAWLDEAEVEALRAEGLPLTPVANVKLPVVKKGVACSRHSWGERGIMILAIVILLGFLGMWYYMLEGFLRLLAR